MWVFSDTILVKHFCQNKNILRIQLASNQKKSISAQQKL